MQLPASVDFIQVSDTSWKLKIYSKEDAEKWMVDVQEISKVAWSINKTFKCTERCRNLFKRYYYCHFNTRCLKKNDIRKKKSRNLNCPATLTIKIQRFFEKSKAKEPIDKEFPCTVDFRGIHNHRHDVVDALRERPINTNVKQEIVSLFEKGHSASTAYHTFYMKKMSELSSKYNERVFDRSYFPTKKDVANIWQTKFKQLYGERTGCDMFKKLEEILSSQQETLFKIVKIENQYAVAICTPLMQRAQKIQQASEMMFVDATGNCDTQDHKVYFFVTQSEVGGVPVACIISSSQKSQVFAAAVEALLDIMPVKLQPTVIMTDDDLSERNVLKKYFPISKLILCIFHVLKACWRWLNTSKNGISKPHNQQYYQLFRSVVYANNNDSLNLAKKCFDENCKNVKFREYVKKMYLRIEDWCMFYRRNLPLRGSNTNNYAEVMFRLFKDIPLERTKAFNLPQLADFLCTSFEGFYTQRILDILLQRVDKIVQDRYLPKKVNVIPPIEELGYQQYRVQSFSNVEIFYDVDMTINICTCPIGYNGKHCKHQAAVISKFNILSAFNVISPQNKASLFELATGESPNENVFLPLLVDESDAITDGKIKIMQKISAASSLTRVSETKNIDDETFKCDYTEVIGTLKLKWKEHTENVFNHLTDDPVNFVPAVTTYLENTKKYGASIPALLSGLHTSFKYKGSLGVSHKTSRKGVKIGVQPTAISRRKCKISGKRKLVGRPTIGDKIQAKKTPHSLKTCVSLSKGLGSSKQKK